MSETAEVKRMLAARVAARLAQVPGILAVSLGGSLAREQARIGSDIDLGLYYRGENRPDLEQLREVATDLRGAAEAVTPLGEWGPWINGGAWLSLDGEQVDWLYRDLNRVEKVLEHANQGHVARYVQPGHPHGFHEHIYLAEVHYGLVLSDPGGELIRLQERLEVYPPKLRESLISTYLWQAQFALESCKKPAARGESGYVAGCLFESVYCLVQVLYALNERYFINEKGALAETSMFVLCPLGFEQAAAEILGQVGADAEALERSRRRTAHLLTEVQHLAEV